MEHARATSQATGSPQGKMLAVPKASDDVATLSINPSLVVIRVTNDRVLIGQWGGAYGSRDSALQYVWPGAAGRLVGGGRVGGPVAGARAHDYDA